MSNPFDKDAEESTLSEADLARAALEQAVLEQDDEPRVAAALLELSTTVSPQSDVRLKLTRLAVDIVLDGFEALGGDIAEVFGNRRDETETPDDPDLAAAVTEGREQARIYRAALAQLTPEEGGGQVEGAEDSRSYRQACADALIAARTHVYETQSTSRRDEVLAETDLWPELLSSGRRPWVGTDAILKALDAVRAHIRQTQDPAICARILEETDMRKKLKAKP